MKAKTGMKKRVASLVLAVVLCCGTVFMLPVQANAVIMQNGKPVITVYTTEIGFAGHTWVVAGDNTSGVLSGNNSHVTLLLKNGDAGFSGYTESKFNSSGYSKYPDGELHNAMVGIYDDIGTGSSMEQRLIVSKVLDDVRIDTTGAAVTWTSTPQYVWPLSTSELNTIHVDTRDPQSWVSELIKYSSSWWLRSSEGEPYAKCGNFAGISTDSMVVTDSYAVRPALILNLSNVLFTSAATAAAGGKPTALATTALSDAAVPTTEAVKFTIEDPYHASNNPTGQALAVTATTQSGTSLAFAYSGATTGANQYVSCVLTQGSGAGEAVKYYGKLAASGTGSGTLSIPLSGVADGTYTLKLFSEQANGDNYTDFCSTPITFTVVVTSGSGEILSDNTLTDPATGISVSGPMYGGTTLAAGTTNVLHPAGCAACDHIRGMENQGRVLAKYEVALNAPIGFHFSYTVTLPVDAAYNGQVLTILHCNNGTLEQSTDTASGGAVKTTVTSFSPFAVLKAADATPQPAAADPGPGSPQTGDRSNIPLWVLSGGVALAGLAALCGMALRKRFGRKAG